jgi:hypothetical protein
VAVLVSHEHYRCRNCGAESSEELPPRLEVSVTPAQHAANDQAFRELAEEGARMINALRRTDTLTPAGTSTTVTNTAHSSYQQICYRGRSLIRGLRSEDLDAVLRAWGKAHGYQGRVGGWIYKGNQRRCQGWDSVWAAHWKEILDWLTTTRTAAASFEALVEAEGGYRPTISIRNAEDAVLAQAYDSVQQARGDHRRVYPDLQGQLEARNQRLRERSDTRRVNRNARIKAQREAAGTLTPAGESVEVSITEAARQLRAQPRTARYERRCPHCGNDFVAARRDQKFCQERCRVAAHRVNRRRPEQLTIERWAERAEKGLAEAEGLLRTIGEDYWTLSEPEQKAAWKTVHYNQKGIDEVWEAIRQVRELRQS